MDKVTILILIIILAAGPVINYRAIGKPRETMTQAVANATVFINVVLICGLIHVLGTLNTI